MSDAQQSVLDAYFDGINGEHYESVGALFAPEGVLIAPGISARHGSTEIAAYFARALRPYPVHRDDPTRIIHAAGTATVEIEFAGALDSGEPISFAAVDIFDFDGLLRITRLTTWYDSHLVRQLLANARGAGSTSSPATGS